eukprot:TRINITY_DN238_c0_g2_i1.p1 TRINITY_DN238_c0_g2~~TRINITY_DN238_c0_g2_i1.p1  ORF type:complete len:403 (-),score=68.64 TRINITY_DN238_c0_g2_i1:52-1260(-)
MTVASLLPVAVFLCLTVLSSAAVPAKYLHDEEADTLQRASKSPPYYRPPHKFTERPVIGILSLPVTVASQTKYGRSSFATSYVRWLEAGGARTVPILFDSTTEELDYLLPRLNGVFWTGGLVDFNPEVEDPIGSLYLETTHYIWRHIVAQNEAGVYYPFWGTCLGFERIIQLFAHDHDSSIFEDVDAENLGINLELTGSGWLSRLFGGMSYELFKEVASPYSTLAFNNHGLGVHPEVLKASPAGKIFKILSVDEDRNDVLFVSTIEGKKYPFYGVQWHPEKAPWEWTIKYNMSHTQRAIEFSNYVARFFVEECKYNNNKFESATVEGHFLMHNWPSRPTGAIHGIISAYSEITFFKGHYKVNITQLTEGAKKGDALNVEAIHVATDVTVDAANALPRKVALF